MDNFERQTRRWVVAFPLHFQKLCKSLIYPHDTSFCLFCVQTEFMFLLWYFFAWGPISQHEHTTDTLTTGPVFSFAYYAHSYNPTFVKYTFRQWNKNELLLNIFFIYFSFISGFFCSSPSFLLLRAEPSLLCIADGNKRKQHTVNKWYGFQCSRDLESTSHFYNASTCIEWQLNHGGALNFSF